MIELLKGLYGKETLYAPENVEEFQKRFSNSLEKVVEENEEAIKKYLLWAEYLKRSEKYKNVCEWIENAKKEKPYEEKGKIAEYFKDSGADDYDQFLSGFFDLNSFKPVLTLEYFYEDLLELEDISQSAFEEISFFSWARIASFPYDTEMLINYFVFGNLFTASSNLVFFRILTIIDMQSRVNVFEMHEALDLPIAATLNYIRDNLKEEPTLDLFIDRFKEIIKFDGKLNICILDPYKNKKDILKSIDGRIDNYRERIGPVKDELAEDNYEYFPRRFECPQGNIRMDELIRYLKAHVLKKAGKTNKEIAKILYKDIAPDEYPDESHARRVMRDRRKAKRIIENVEQGFFPGNYNK